MSACWCCLQQYQDDVPSDYEPEFFKPAADGSILSTDHLPLKINVGSLKTPTVDMKMKFSGLDSLLFEDLCKVGVATNDGSLSKNQRQTHLVEPALFSGETFIKEQKDNELVSGLGSMHVSPMAVNQVSRPSSPVQSDEADKSVAAVKAYM